MKKVLAGLFFGFLLIFASLNSYAETHGCMEKGMHNEGMPMMEGMKHSGMGMMRAEHSAWRHLRGLGLDEKQKEAIRDIRSRLVKDTISKRADIQIARVELRDILHKEPVDMQAAAAMLKQIASLATDMRLSHIKAMEDVKAQLTPEQKEKFKKILERRREWGRGCRGKGPGKKEEMQPTGEHVQH